MKKIISCVVIVTMINTIIFGAFNQNILASVDYLGTYNQSNNFGIANDFNVFVLEDAVKGGADSEGRFAVGGNATLGNFTNRANLIVGGNLILSSNTVNQSGNTTYANSFVTNGYNLWHNGGSGQTTVKASVIDFDSAKTHLQSLSVAWSGIADNSVSKNVNPYNQMYLVGNDPDLNVFNLNGENVLGSGKPLSALEIHINVPHNSTILVNVSGANVGFSNFAMFINNSTPNGNSWGNKKLVWNIYEATDIS